MFGFFSFTKSFRSTVAVFANLFPKVGLSCWWISVWQQRLLAPCTQVIFITNPLSPKWTRHLHNGQANFSFSFVSVKLLKDTFHLPTSKEREQEFKSFVSTHVWSVICSRSEKSRSWQVLAEVKVAVYFWT